MHPDADAHHAGRHPRQLGNGDAHRVRAVGHRPGEAGEEVAETVGEQGALHRAEIDGARPAPGDPLDGDGVAEGVHRAHQRHEHERRQERPEGRTEVEIEPDVRDGRQTDPRGVADARGVVDAEDEAADGAPDDQADHRGPQAPCAAEAQSGRDHDGQGHARGDGRRRRRRSLGHVGQLAQEGRGHAHRNQHQDGAGHGRGEHLAEQRQLGGQGELKQAGHEDQGGEQPLPAPLEGGHADGEERGGAAHEEDIARPDASDADGLDDGGDAADHEGGADRPCQIGVAAAGAPDHDDRREDDAGYVEEGVLQPQPEREQGRRPVVGLVANILAGVSVSGVHGVILSRERLRFIRATPVQRDPAAPLRGILRHPRCGHVSHIRGAGLRDGIRAGRRVGSCVHSWRTRECTATFPMGSPPWLGSMLPSCGATASSRHSNIRTALRSSVTCTALTRVTPAVSNGSV